MLIHTATVTQTQPIKNVPKKEQKKYQIKIKSKNLSAFKPFLIKQYPTAKYTENFNCYLNDKIKYAYILIDQYYNTIVVSDKFTPNVDLYQAQYRPADNSISLCKIVVRKPKKPTGLDNLVQKVIEDIESVTFTTNKTKAVVHIEFFKEHKIGDFPFTHCTLFLKLHPKETNNFFVAMEAVKAKLAAKVQELVELKKAKELK